MPEGQIIKALSGYYYVKEENTNEIWQCRGRGIFKKREITPLVGDYVTFEGTNQKEGTVTAVHQRKNELIRPPVANVDQALLVFSVEEPSFSPILLDKYLVHIEQADIQPLICLTKLDLQQEESSDKVPEEARYYQEIGYTLFMVSSTKEWGIDSLEEYLKGKITVLAGQSGVGKSSLLNALDRTLELETGEISQRLGRGKHTTRHVELLELPFGGWVVDTPGFSQLDFSEIEPIDLWHYFIEFADYAPQCRFRGCIHQNEPNCAVKEAVAEGSIAQARYQHYLQFLQEIEAENQRKRY